MRQKVKDKPIDNKPYYERSKGLTQKQYKKLTAEQIVWHIYRISKDKREHILWEDCARWLDCKMREISKLASLLERSKP